MPYFWACTGEVSKEAPAGEVTTDEKADADQEFLEAADVPATSTTMIPGTVSPEGVIGENATFEQDANAFLKAVVTDDRELIEESITDEMVDRIDTLIDDIGFREFLEEDDYDALWEKVESVGKMAFTAVTGEEMIMFWMVDGKDIGLKNLQAQFELVSVDDRWRVKGYSLVD
jgi:hypothetical protein